MNQRLVKAFSCRHIKILYREFFQLIFLAKKTQYMKILTKVWIKPFYNFRYTRCNNLYHNQKYILVWEEVYIHVYKLKESELGFYHTGIELHGVEFTYCENKWLWLPDRIIVQWFRCSISTYINKILLMKLIVNLYEIMNSFW